MISLKEISERIKQGKKNNGRFLVNHLLPYFEKKIPYDVIVKMLHDEYDITITELKIAQYKTRYFIEKQNNKEIKTLKPAGDEIAANEKKETIRDREWIEKMLDTSDIPPKITKF